MNPTKPNIGIRIASMLMDHFIMTFILVFFMFIFVGLPIILLSNSEIRFNNSPLIATIPFILGFLTFSIYLNKDAIKGKSPAKRLLGLIIIDHKTGQIASPIQCVLRNITLIFWPIEVIFSLFSTSRRIGDYIARTEVVIDNKTLQTNIRFTQILVSLIIGCLIIMLALIPQLFLSGLNPFSEFF